MSTHTFQIGIDLGTTNSEIAVYENGKVNIIKNINQDQFTPSVFGVDKFNNKLVGKKAYEKLYVHYSKEDASNSFAEVKRIMGSPEKKYFSRLDKSLLPEEISAEILMSLRADLLRNHPDMNASAAVITVPASFSTLQSEATKRAGNLAGFDHVVLLQEPIAAAIAYGFSDSTNENWLVYDLGGGTFDSALISYQDGLLNVLGHEGDNFLGGKNFDWLLVDNLIVPKIQKEYELNSFSRENIKYQAVFAILKGKAEEAKIELSQLDKTTIEISNIGNDDDEKEIYLQIQITRSELESLIEPAISRSIQLVKKTIKDTGIKKSTISRIILIGGPTQIPYVRKRLKEEFESKIDTSVDPFTAVASGACIFATGQKIPEIQNEKSSEERKGVKEIKLNYESMTSDSDTMISGIIDQLKNEEDEYFIQIQGESGLYNSPKIKIKKGKFIETIPLEKHKSNLFWIYLFDNKGNSLPLSSDSFSITQGLTIKGVPLPHSVGVSYIFNDQGVNSNNVEKFDVYFEKGSTLPLTKTKTFHTARKLEKDTENILPIKVYEGEAINPLNNVFVCGLDIKGNKLPFDLPAGTDIDISINIDESRELTVGVYIPSIDLSENARATVMDEKIDVEELIKECQIQRKNLEDIKCVCSDEEIKDFENRLLSIDRSLLNASTDEDEKKKVSKDMKEFKNAIDEIKKKKELPKQISEFNEQITSISQMIGEYGIKEDKERDTDQLNLLSKEGKKAIEENDKGLLRRTNEQLKNLGDKIFYNNPNTWLYLYEEVSNGKHVFTNIQEAQYYLKKGREAIDGNDPDELKRCVRELINLLPKEEKAKIDSRISGITK